MAFQAPGGSPDPYAAITDPINWQSSGPAQHFGPDQLGPGVLQAALLRLLQSGGFGGDASTRRGSVAGAAPGVITSLMKSGFGPGGPKGFSWGGRTWGPNDFAGFSNWLANHGISVGQFARAHPAAFATFNIDPNIQKLIAGQYAAPAGGMAHA